MQEILQALPPKAQVVLESSAETWLQHFVIKVAPLRPAHTSTHTYILATQPLVSHPSRSPCCQHPAAAAANQCTHPPWQGAPH
eukprot:1156184-Pelagomonas_calceolata.AAC.26